MRNEEKTSGEHRGAAIGMMAAGFVSLVAAPLGVSAYLIAAGSGPAIAAVSIFASLASIAAFIFQAKQSFDDSDARMPGEPVKGREARALLATFNATLNNMPQGVALYDNTQQIRLANRQYAEMYGLAEDDIPPGTTMKEILEKRVAKGIFIGDDAASYIDARVSAMANPEDVQGVERFADGRIIHKSRKRMPDGGWLSVHEDVTERQRAQDQIDYMAHHDTLTGLFNRAMLPARIDAARANIRDHGGEFAILLLDLDDFKVVNDTLGHAVGDKLLRRVADRLRAAARDTDFVARIGGDEFAILRPSKGSGVEGAYELALALMESVGAPYDIDGMPIAVHLSIGVAVAPADGDDSQTLLKNADLALFQAKANGKPSVRFFEPEMDLALRVERTLESDLRQALAGDEFEVHYQAVVDTGTHDVTGMEALVRWRHPRLGMVPPDRFIKLAEKTGLINALGEWVLGTACKQAVSWPDHVKLAVNLSPAQFKSGDLVEMVKRCVEASGLPPRRLTLEITETTLLEKSKGNLELLKELKNFGVSIALDDFGTGYSSLSYLKTIPFDVIKIDRSFVMEMATNMRSAQIVAGIVALSSSLNFTTVAEGIETEEQLELIRAAGCTAAQGYFFARPKPAVDLMFGNASPVKKVEKAA